MIKIKKGFFTEESTKVFSKHLLIKFMKKGFVEKDYLGPKYSEFFRTTSTVLSEKIYRNLTRNLSKTSQDIKTERAVFEKKLYEIWNEPLQLLDAFLFFLIDVSKIYYEDQREIVPKVRDYLLEALIRINGRACKTGYEILALLEKGFPDGAYARWRTLHELAVTALFIQKNKAELAEKYLLHENIESYQGMLAYRKFSTRNKNTPFPDQEVERVKKIYDELIVKYGEDYKSDFGWASKTLNVPKPNFTHLEEFVKLDHARPHVKMANHSVHSTAKGNYFSFGVPDSKTMLLTGASQIGMAGPGYDAAISLMQCCAALLTSKPFPQTAVILQTIQKFVEEIGRAFYEVEEKMD
jgi:hypothetical protein